VDPTLLSLLPTGGVATVLVAVIVYLLRQNHLDRTQYRADVAAIWARSTEESAAQAARHAAEIASMDERRTKENKEVAAKIADLQATVARSEETTARALAAYEAERGRRWAAEEAAAHYKLLAEKGDPARE